MRNLMYLKRAITAFLAAAVLTACGSDSSTSVTSVEDAAVHNAHSVFVGNDGIVYDWGYNGYGQLGNGTSVNSSTPVAVPGIAGITGASAGGTHTLAFKNNSSVWAWGNNGSGRLGDNTTTARVKPVQVVDKNKTPLTGIIAVSAGGNHSLALDKDFSVWGWGANYAGQLGDNTIVNKPYAVKVNLSFTNSSTATKVAAGGSHSLALMSDGTVRAWGYNGHGQLGNNSTTSTLAGTAPTSPAVQVLTAPGTPLQNIVAIAAGGGHSLAVDSNGELWAWGLNSWGQLGTGNTVDSLMAVKVSVKGPASPGKILSIAAGLDHSLVVLAADTTVWGWGANFYGQLGNGSLRSLTGQTTPVQVKLDSNNTPLTGVLAVVAEGDHSIGIGSAPGTIWSWGDNTFGQLGNGTKGTGTGFAGPVTGLP